VSTWLLAIARTRRFRFCVAAHEELDEEVAEFIEDRRTIRKVKMQKKQQSTVLQECLTQLSPAHREIIDLVYYHEKSIDEVAEIVGVPATR